MRAVSLCSLLPVRSSSSFSVGVAGSASVKNKTYILLILLLYKTLFGQDGSDMIQSLFIKLLNIIQSAESPDGVTEFPWEAG